MDYELFEELDDKIETIKELYEEKKDLETFIDEHKDMAKTIRGLGNTIDLLWITTYFERRESISFFENEKEDDLESLQLKINELQLKESELEILIDSVKQKQTL